MSDSDDDVSHVFDQTNGVIAAADGEADGALSGRTTTEIEDPTGSTVAGSPPTDADVSDRDDDRGGTAAATDAGPRTGASAVVAEGDGSARSEDLPDRPEDDRASRDRGDLGPADRSTRPTEAADEEHRYAVDAGGTATDEGLVPAGSTDPEPARDTSSGDAASTSYSDAPAVAAWSAADDGRDEGSTRGESSTRPVDDASHTGRLADAYETGPAEEADRGRTEAGREPVVDTAADSDAAPAQGSEAAASGAAEPSADDQDGQREGRSDSLSALAGDDDSIGHVFDQTNGVIDGASGESDGTADGDSASRADRDV